MLVLVRHRISQQSANLQIWSAGHHNFLNSFLKLAKSLRNPENETEGNLILIADGLGVTGGKTEMPEAGANSGVTAELETRNPDSVTVESIRCSLFFNCGTKLYSAP